MRWRVPHMSDFLLICGIFYLPIYVLLELTKTYK